MMCPKRKELSRFFFLLLSLKLLMAPESSDFYSSVHGDTNLVTAKLKIYIFKNLFLF